MVTCLGNCRLKKIVAQLYPFLYENKFLPHSSNLLWQDRRLYSSVIPFLFFLTFHSLFPIVLSVLAFYSLSLVIHTLSLCRSMSTFFLLMPVFSCPCPCHSTCPSLSRSVHIQGRAESRAKPTQGKRKTKVHA